MFFLGTICCINCTIIPPISLAFSLLVINHHHVSNKLDGLPSSIHVLYRPQVHQYFVKQSTTWKWISWFKRVWSLHRRFNSWLQKHCNVAQFDLLQAECGSPHLTWQVVYKSLLPLLEPLSPRCSDARQANTANDRFLPLCHGHTINSTNHALPEPKRMAWRA